MLNDETLEERLHQDLDRVRPGVVPLDALIGRGRVIKARRRAGFAAGLAAVAALAVGTPVVLGVGGSSGVSSGGHKTVLASGTIDGKEWSFVTGEPLPEGCTVGLVNATWGNSGAGTCLGAFPTATDPVFLTSSGGEGTVGLFIAQLRGDVDHVTVTGTDGTVRTPTVAGVSGRRYAFFALPPAQGIARLDAFGADGKAIAYTVPYNGPDNSPAGLIESWYQAGVTPTQAAVKQTLFSDTSTSTTPVTVTVDMGPFGVCYLLSAPPGMGGATGYGPDCHSVTPPAATALALQSYPFGEQVLLLAEVNTAVGRVDVMKSDGSTVRLTPVRIGGHSFVVTFLAPGIEVSGAKAYDASGKQLAKTP